jgi:hypothetical protein
MQMHADMIFETNQSSITICGHFRVLVDLHWIFWCPKIQNADVGRWTLKSCLRNLMVLYVLRSINVRVNVLYEVLPAWHVEVKKILEVLLQ